jgi:hypothetical protein
MGRDRQKEGVWGDGGGQIRNMRRERERERERDDG